MRKFSDGDEFIYLNIHGHWVCWERRDGNWYSPDRESVGKDSDVDQALSAIKEDGSPIEDVMWVSGPVTVEKYK